MGKSLFFSNLTSYSCSAISYFDDNWKREKKLRKVEKLTKAIEQDGPQAFSRNRIKAEKNLFVERCALFFTPTESIPSKWIGEGLLDITLPIPTPSYYELFELRGYRTPRIWVDLLQRATGKIRWRPNVLAQLRIIRYDYIKLPYHSIAGAKALIDSLKVQTAGRSDGRLLYYFGAILDDGPKYIELEFQQELVTRPSEAKTRVIVQPTKA